jgi:hypothetical protein
MSAAKQTKQRYKSTIIAYSIKRQLQKDLVNRFRAVQLVLKSNCAASSFLQRFTKYCGLQYNLWSINEVSDKVSANFRKTTTANFN